MLPLHYFKPREALWSLTIPDDVRDNISHFHYTHLYKSAIIATVFFAVRQKAAQFFHYFLLIIIVKFSAMRFHNPRHFLSGWLDNAD